MISPARTSFVVFIAQIITGICGVFLILYLGQEIIVPLVYAWVLAILLNPCVNYLKRKGFNRNLAITLVLIVALVVIAALFFFIYTQLAQFGDTLTALKVRLTEMLGQGVHWASSTFGIGTDKINNWIEQMRTKALETGGSLAGTATMSFLNFIVLVIIMPIYVFMFLYYKPLLLEFIARLFPSTQHVTVTEVLSETKGLIQSYLVGLLIEAGIVAVLNSIGLLAIGLDYAILFAVLGALLNIIPYLGGVIAITLPFLFALATASPARALWVIVVYFIVQIIDNNYLVPKIVGSKVKINALASIVVVLIGAAVWGISGMFLSIPITAICKVIFDRIQPLKPFGYLLGDTMPEDGKTSFRIGRKFRKANQNPGAPPSDNVL